MAIGNIIYSTSSTTISSGDIINASDFERSTNLQIDTVSGNLNITGGINTSGVSTLGNVGNILITGGEASEFITTDGASTLTWNANTRMPMLANALTYTRKISNQLMTDIPDDVRKITIFGSNITATTTTSVGNIQVGPSSGVWGASNFFGVYTYISSSANNIFYWPDSDSIPLLENDNLSFVIILDRVNLSGGVNAGIGLPFPPSSGQTTRWYVTGEIINFNYNGTGTGNLVILNGSIYQSGSINQVLLNTSGDFTGGELSVMYEF
jgi:hypothetical protein